MRYYIIVGEASGDLHGSNLMKELSKLDKNAIFRGYGGDKMLQSGIQLVKHYREMALMGFWEVITRLKELKKNISDCKKDVLNFNPDVLILIDYAGFNLRIAEFAKKNNIKVVYYISPKIWAWKKSRIKKIKAYVDNMYVILPFEEDFYKSLDYKVQYVGNPIMDEINKFKQNYSVDQVKYDIITKSHKPIIALLPGSRKSEINRLLPEMIEAAESYKEEFTLIVAGISSANIEWYQKYLNESFHLVIDQTYELLNNSFAALVTSGTATLETALFKVPECVIFKTSLFNYIIGKQIISIKFFSLVNLIMNGETVKELLQFDLAEKIKIEMDKILFNKDYRNNMNSQLEILVEKIGDAGASESTAKAIYSNLN